MSEVQQPFAVCVCLSVTYPIVFCFLFPLTVSCYLCFSLLFFVPPSLSVTVPFVPPGPDLIQPHATPLAFSCAINQGASWAAPKGSLTKITVSSTQWRVMMATPSLPLLLPLHPSPSPSLQHWSRQGKGRVVSGR